VQWDCDDDFFSLKVGGIYVNIICFKDNINLMIEFEEFFLIYFGVKFSYLLIYHVHDECSKCDVRLDRTRIFSVQQFI
jgi:hypothetical protein